MCLDYMPQKIEDNETRSSPVGEGRKKMANSTIFDIQTGETLAEGVQSQLHCDATIRTACDIAAKRGHSVVVVDHGTREHYCVTSDGHVTRAPNEWPDPFVDEDGEHWY